jgi:hypothetical protein
MKKVKEFRLNEVEILKSSALKKIIGGDVSTSTNTADRDKGSVIVPPH